MKVHSVNLKLQTFLKEHPIDGVEIVDDPFRCNYLISGRYNKKNYNQDLKGVIIPYTGHNGIDLDELREDNVMLFVTPTRSKYVAEKARIHLGEDNSKKMITIHLGGGCSMTAVKNGESVDTSLGFGPNEGLIMGSRSGAVDNSIIFYLVNNLGYDLNDVNNMLQKESGMIGLTGCLSDYRDIEAEAEKGDEKCQLALNMSAYRIKHYLGGYIANLNGVDAIIFTAGVGENSIVLRKMVCESMEFFGIEIDEEKNDIKARK